MKDVLLVAVREFRQIVATRGFWIMLLIVPLAIGAAIFASSRLAPQPGVAFTLVDHSGRFAERLEERLERDHQREILRDLSAYVERWDLVEAEPTAPWAHRGSWMVDAEVERFVRLGGADGALDRLRAALPREAPEFEMPKRLFPRADPPGTVPTEEGPEAFGAALAPALKENVQTPDGKMPLALGIYVPENLGAPEATARVWTNGGVNYGLLNIVREELTAGLRLDVMQASGLSADAAAQVQALSAPMVVTEPAVGEERGFFATRSIIPVALMYLLLITAVTTGSMMLQGVIEERSNKLLESVLACIRPAALMNGKLLGLGGVGLGIILVWLVCGVAAMLSGSGSMSDAFMTSVAALDQPWMWAAMIFYFLAGYLILSMVFLAIGALSDSMQDAQAYLGPVLIVVMLPLMIMMQASLRDPESLFTQVLSWIPLYTPFAMLTRLGTGVSLVEVVGTTVLLVAFIALELLVLGRLFQASVLNAGKPGWRGILAVLRP
jgi:ABC-2 type transport system permease protein